MAQSMGGFFALAFALEHPAWVERLILVGAPAGVDRAVPLRLRLLGQPGLGPLMWKTARSALLARQPADDGVSAASLRRHGGRLAQRR